MHYAFSQQISIYGSDGYDKNFVIISTQDIQDDLIDSFWQDFENKNDFYVWLISPGVENNNLMDSLNLALNGGKEISKSYIYHIIIGNESFIASKDVFEEDIFADIRTIETKSLDKQILDTTLTSLRKKYTWYDAISEVRERNVRIASQNKKTFDLGLRYGLFHLKDFSVPSKISTWHNRYGVQLSYNINNIFTLGSNFHFGFQLPNPQDEIQSQIIDQIDFEEVLSGDAGVEEIEINAKLNGHVYINFSTFSQFKLPTKSGWDPTLTVGLSVTSYSVFEGIIDTIVEIDLNEFTPGSTNGLGDFEPDDQEDNIDIAQYRYISIPIGIGIKKTLGEVIVFETSISYDFSPRNSSTDYLRTIAFNFGLSYRFGRKQKPFYNYIRLKK